MGVTRYTINLRDRNVIYIYQELLSIQFSICWSSPLKFYPSQFFLTQIEENLVLFILWAIICYAWAKIRRDCAFNGPIRLTLFLMHLRKRKLLNDKDHRLLGHLMMANCAIEVILHPEKYIHVGYSGGEMYD